MAAECIPRPRPGRVGPCASAKVSFDGPWHSEERGRARPSGSRGMSSPVRWLLLALPVALVVFVTVVLVTGGSARPYRVARVWGGPTDGKHVSLRVEAFEVVVDRASVQEIPMN